MATFSFLCRGPQVVRWTQDPPRRSSFDVVLFIPVHVCRIYVTGGGKSERYIKILQKCMRKVFPPGISKCGFDRTQIVALHRSSNISHCEHTHSYLLDMYRYKHWISVSGLARTTAQIRHDIPPSLCGGPLMMAHLSVVLRKRVPAPQCRRRKVLRWRTGGRPWRNALLSQVGIRERKQLAAKPGGRNKIASVINVVLCQHLVGLNWNAPQIDQIH